MGPGDQSPGRDRQGDEQDDGFGRPAPDCARVLAKFRSGRAADDPEGYPKDRRVDGESKGQMGDEPVLADLRAIGETTLDHIPSERTLAEAKQQNAGERAHQRTRQLSPQQKPDKGHAIGDADQTP